MNVNASSYVSPEIVYYAIIILLLAFITPYGLVLCFACIDEACKAKKKVRGYEECGGPV